MKETHWRDKLVREFKKAHPGAFIWAMDSHFKAGFPDLYIKAFGEPRPLHLELKVTEKESLDCLTLLEPIQRVVLDQLKDAGAWVGMLVLHKKSKCVTEVNLCAGTQKKYTAEKFKKRWTEGGHFG